MIKRSSLFIFSLFILITGWAQVDGNAPSVNISIKAVPGLQYDLVRFIVKPRTKVTLSLANADDMSHNLIVTLPGSRLEVVNAALQLAEKGPQRNYIPDMQQVLWAIPVVTPGQVKSVTFTAPSKPGIYPYVCTSPGHGFLMYGAMYVMEEDLLPDLISDVNIPEARRKDTAAGKKEGVHPGPVKESLSPHPYALIAPYLYRVFIDGASPAAIAVRLPSELSYCWDAGVCKLRFAWKGGFVDNTDLWKGHSDASARVLGDVFFRDNLEYPLRLGKNAELPLVEYKGYRLVDRYPEFHYTINGIDVFELILSKKDGNGLVREFRIPHAGGPVWFYTNHLDDSIVYDFSTGRRDGGRLELTAAEALRFTVTMTSYPLVFQKIKK